MLKRYGVKFGCTYKPRGPGLELDYGFQACTIITTRNPQENPRKRFAMQSIYVFGGNHVESGGGGVLAGPSPTLTNLVGPPL